LGFFGPLGQHFVPQLAELFDGPRFGLMGCAPFGHRLIDEVGQAQQALPQARVMSKTLVETRLFLIGIRQFNIH
jgi:hypothetical protein